MNFNTRETVALTLELQIAKIGPNGAGIILPASKQFSFIIKDKTYLLKIDKQKSEDNYNHLILKDGEKILGILDFSYGDYPRSINATHMEEQVFEIWNILTLEAKNIGFRHNANNQRAKNIRSDPTRPPIGTLLMKSLIRLAELSKVIHWITGVSAPTAITFYEQLGFNIGRDDEITLKIRTPPITKVRQGGGHSKKKTRHRRALSRKNRIYW